MKKEKIDSFLDKQGKKFHKKDLDTISYWLSDADHSISNKVYKAKYSDPAQILLVSIVGGLFGIDRFCLGQKGLGVLKLITLGGFGVWWLLDCFTAVYRTRNNNFSKVATYLD